MARPQHISDDTITKALAAAGEVTAPEVADLLGMGQSTAAKRLAALEGAEAVRRQPGGRVNGARVADRWSVPAVPAGDASARQPEPGAPDVSAQRESGSPTKPASSKTATSETGRPEGADPSAGSERLGRGALGVLVRDYLAARPDEDLGPTQVGKALGRSQGAVSNALARLEATGEARLVSVTPRRYRIVADR